MRILIVSDSHGNAKVLQQVYQKTQPDHLIHCGDFCTSIDKVPGGSSTVVRGNCDYANISEEQIWMADTLSFFVTHGHRYQVKSTLLAVQYRAEELGAQIACFGHSHYPVCEQPGPVLLINPGSLVQPRGFYTPTYAMLQLKGSKQVEVTFHTPQGKKIKERGGNFSF